MNQANIALLPLWRSLGNTGDLPVGWNGPASAADITRDAENAAQARAAEQQARVTEFTGRTQSQIPAALTALETRVGLPEARNTYLSAGIQAQNVAGQVRDVAPAQTAISKQVGISAPRLQKRIASETVKLQPSIESSTRGLEAANLGLTTATGAYQTGAEGIYKPFEIEAGILGDNVKSQFDLIKQNTINATDKAIAELEAKGRYDVQALANASAAALKEKELLDAQYVDAGNRIVIMSGGKEVGSILKGLSPTKGSTASSGW